MEEDFYDTSEDLTRTARSTDLTGVGKSQLQHFSPRRFDLAKNLLQFMSKSKNSAVDIITKIVIIQSIDFMQILENNSIRHENIFILHIRIIGYWSCCVYDF